MSRHRKFITTYLYKLIEETLNACSSANSGISSFPLCEYVMQTTFLKLTGASEQKLKCILWDLATDDYEFRYSFLKENYGECSNYKSKNAVFKNLIDCIRKIDFNFEITDVTKSEIIENTKDKCNKIFSKALFKEWLPREYIDYKSFTDNVSSNQILTNTNGSYGLFAKKDSPGKNEKQNNLKNAFDAMYDHRNRCAHNSLSYQDNLPAFSKMNSENYKYENWFIRFFVLNLLDEIFIHFYEIYEKKLYEKI